ncbi:flavin monoamine oxidase family protein [Halobacillus salinarum]|uniref:Flavin monoamine oxidase family protein n=1 Tax=Halobacillus salinarum TaxID=2932257 RepID=A0ABY4EF77_9BACI|nr:flavin monoamine oxidase family protein [Halobacillus salinarum]UOQ42811.1 flavin monoamine oxidase family protein [Halobacillus salinarum]
MMRFNNSNDLKYPEDLLSIIRNGLSPKKKDKHILIAGAGMAGLVTGSLLKQAGYRITIIEANNRIGGRIFTVRKPFTQGNYLDVGAMRIPDTHELAMAYIQKFHLSLHPFMNTSDKDFIFVNNVLTTKRYYEKHPEVLQYPLVGWEKGKTATELLTAAIQPFLDKYENSNQEEKNHLKQEYSRYSIGEFLKYNPLGPSLSKAAVRLIGVLLGIEGFPEFSFLDILTDIIYPIFNKETQFFEINGGNDHLPHAFLPHLASNIVFNQRIKRIYQSSEGVTFETAHTVNGDTYLFSGDEAVITLPFTVLQFIDMIPFESVSFQKRKAICELPSVPSIKIGMEFKHRFWETMNYGNIISDQPIRFTYPSSHQNPFNSSGVLLASYSWGQNALLWNSVSPSQMTEMVLKDLANVYGTVVYKEFRQSISFNWSRNPFSAGCFTLFIPGQGENFSEYIRQPEGKLHFAGEHTSNFHGWIEGAIESGIRAAYELHQGIER